METNHSHYVLTRDLQNILDAHHTKHHSCMKFIDALKAALRHNDLTYKPVCRNSSIYPFLNQTDFLELLLNYPVNASAILNYTTLCDINEQNIFPYGHDIFSFKHLNNLDDTLHTHNYFEMNYVYSGQARQIFQSESRILDAGELCIIAPDSQHSIVALDNSFIISIMIRKSTFDSVFWNILNHKNLLSLFFKNTLYSKNASNYLLFMTAIQEDTNKILQNIVIESNCDDEYSNTCCISYLNLLFIRLIRNYSNTIQYYSNSLIKSNKSLDFDFALFLHYIQSNYQTVTLASLSEIFHYSEVHISRLVKKNLNQNFTDLVRDLKMKHALEYLTTTSRPVHEIAVLVGYNSVDHFSRVFKKTYGTAPQEYRRQHKTS